MSAPVDEIDVGHDPPRRWRWESRRPWSTGSRRTVAVLVVLVAAAATALWFVGRPGDAAGPQVAPPRAAAPGADVVEQVAPDTSTCPPTATCRYDDTLGVGAERVFDATFPSAGFVGRQTVVDAESGVVYWQYLRFATGTLVTVTLTLQPVSQLATVPAVSDTPSDSDRRNGAVTLTALRGGFLLTANAAGLPGQLLPVPAVQQWLRTVPTP